jgi:hypothetical protein
MHTYYVQPVPDRPSISVFQNLVDDACSSSVGIVQNVKVWTTPTEMYVVIGGRKVLESACTELVKKTLPAAALVSSLPSHGVQWEETIEWYRYPPRVQDTVVTACARSKTLWSHLRVFDPHEPCNDTPTKLPRHTRKKASSQTGCPMQKLA